MKTSRIFLLVSVIACAFSIFCFSKIVARADTSSTYEYHYHLQGKTYNSSGKYIVRSYDRIIYSSEPIVGVADPAYQGKNAYLYTSGGKKIYYTQTSYAVIENTGVSDNPPASSGTLTLITITYMQKSWGSHDFYDDVVVTTDIPIFATWDQADEYLRSGDTTGQINKEPVDLENDGIYEPNLEIPRLNVDQDSYDFEFNNGTSEMKVEIKGRWYTVDDIELYKSGVVWKYRYSTLLKSDLNTWVSVDDNLSSDSRLNFKELGRADFDNLLFTYPVDSRNYYGGTNSVGNYFSGFNDALDTLKMLLRTPESLYNSVEIYVRYYYEDDHGNYHYSKWTHWYDGIASSSGSSGSRTDDFDNMYNENESQMGLSPSDQQRVEQTGNSRSDVDAKPRVDSSDINGDSFDGSLNGFMEYMKNLSKYSSSLGGFFESAFSFLPWWATGFLGAALVVVILLRFLGR